MLRRRCGRDAASRAWLRALKLRRQLIEPLLELSDSRPLGSLLDPRRGRRTGKAILFEPMASVVVKRTKSDKWGFQTVRTEARVDGWFDIRAKQEGS